MDVMILNDLQFCFLCFLFIGGVWLQCRYTETSS